jgi:hypothetical protein
MKEELEQLIKKYFEDKDYKIRSLYLEGDIANDVKVFDGKLSLAIRMMK